MKLNCPVPTCQETWDIPLSECSQDEDGAAGFSMNEDYVYCSDPTCNELLAMAGCSCRATKCAACGMPFCNAHLTNGVCEWDEVAVAIGEAQEARYVGRE